MYVNAEYKNFDTTFSHSSGYSDMAQHELAFYTYPMRATLRYHNPRRLTSVLPSISLVITALKRYRYRARIRRTFLGNQSGQGLLPAQIRFAHPHSVLAESKYVGLKALAGYSKRFPISVSEGISVTVCVAAGDVFEPV